MNLRVLQRAYATTEPSYRSDEPRILFGDSTPFPYGLDFLTALRAVVDCCVRRCSPRSTRSIRR